MQKALGSIPSRKRKIKKIEKDSKTASINMFKEQEKIMLKELKESMITMIQQTE